MSADLSETKGGAAPKRVFIVGCRRSGTTWTMLLLGQHPRVVALQQLDFFRRLHHLRSWFSTDEQFGTCILTKPQAAPDVRADAKSGLVRLPLSSAISHDAYLEMARPFAQQVYGHFDTCGEDTLATVEQTPEYVHVWKTVLETFPDAYFLHIVRDPRSVFASHRNAARSWADPTRFSHDAIKVAREWQDEVTRGRRIAEATERYLEVRYEDLRADPVARLQRIFDWAGLPADRSLCEAAVETCTMERMKESADYAPSGFFRAGQVSGWRTELSTREIRTVEYLCSDLMTALGYELDSHQPIRMPTRLRWRQFRERATSRLQHWAWNDDSPLRRTLARTLKTFPGVRKVLLKRIKKPV